MWTMFPWVLGRVAMANCGERFLRGAANQARDPHQASLASNSVSEAERLPKKGASPMSSAHVVAAAAAAVVGAKLPEIRKFAVNADLAPELRPGAAAALAIARSQTKFKTTQSSAANDEVDFTGGDDGAGESVEQLMADHFSHKLEALRATIQSSRGELDALRQERASLQRTLGQVHDQGNELGKMSVSTGDLEITLQSLVIRLEATQRGQRMSKLLHDNYDCVRLMCERHPAHSTALISELEMKLAQDGLFVGEVRRRLRESQFEGRGFTNATKVLQKGSLEMSVLQNAMLTQRIQQRELLQLPAPALAQEIDVPLNTSRFSKSLSSKAVSEDAEESTEAVWEARGDEIRARTFIPDVGDFYGKFHTAQILQSQLQALHFAAEARQRSLKEHLLGVEAERERVRTDSQSKLGTTSREARALQARLRTSRHAHKQSRENALAAERLKRDAFAGLQHVCAKRRRKGEVSRQHGAILPHGLTCTTLGVPPPDADTPVAEVVHAVESVLDALIEEKDKAAQRTADASQSLRDDELKARSPELEAALDQFEMPKALIAHRLTGKPKDDPAALANDSNDAAVPSRTDVKRDAQKSVRAEQRRQARLVGVPEK
ncbi:hypothetical protein M885DRAFT_497564 [Pelagophyceae sp. CCMP2097]|nr:hypothetical protein M885DRAFT_497564 [Pelagophyceae sp. CCMP2097]